jgi:hypothetical protein
VRYSELRPYDIAVEASELIPHVGERPVARREACEQLVEAAPQIPQIDLLRFLIGNG